MNENKSTLTPNWSDKTILIVEDDKFNVIIIANFIQKTKAKYQVASTGEMAIEMALALKPDIVLMDVKLPNISGYEAAIEIRKTLPDIKIIAQTAYSTENDKDLALQAGCIDFISKPIRFEKLIEVVSKYL